MDWGTPETLRDYRVNTLAVDSPLTCETMYRWVSPAPLLALLLAISACELPPAHGDVNAFIVGASPELWAQVEDVFLDAMESTVQTVRDERPFRITHQDPMELADWGLLQRFRQVLVLGVIGDPWIDEALAVMEEPAGPAPTVGQVLNVWARGQQVSVLILPATGQVEAVRQLSRELHKILDDQFRSYAVNRMFISGEDLALADSLMANVGFSVRLPVVYQYSTQDSIFRFRNDNPRPAELIREISVSWRTPAVEANPTAEELHVWRDAFTAEYYNDPQLVDMLAVSFGEFQSEAGRGVEYQAAWVSPPGAWPAGGPFITRVLTCPSQDRTYYLDAWLYAPGRDKYEYLIQLQTVLDSFRCR
jgi:hypothetical protein